MKKITVIGGDDRLKVVERDLRNANMEVDTLGLYENDNANITTSDVLVLPVPTTRDALTVNTPLTGRPIPLSHIKDNTTDRQLILCCGYLFQNKNCIDYGALDSYSILNAVPTAEGAIKAAIELTPYTLWQSRVLVIGYGRVGKILADRLKALGCDVTVSARKPVDFSMLDAYGFKHIHSASLNDKPLEYDIIFNTVDVKVIDDSALADCKADLMIDLSSKGGFCLKTANENHIKAMMLPSIPGKIAPQTAGKILSKTIMQLIDQYN